MSDFEKTTMRKSEEFLDGLAISTEKFAFIKGRNTTKPSLLVACRVLEGFQLGHLHYAEEKHIRVMGDDYGWCDFCQEKVNFGPGDAEQAIAQIKAAGDWPLTQAPAENEET